MGKDKYVVEYEPPELYSDLKNGGSGLWGGKFGAQYRQGAVGPTGRNIKINLKNDSTIVSDNLLAHYHGDVDENKIKGKMKFCKFSGTGEVVLKSTPGFFTFMKLKDESITIFRAFFVCCDDTLTIEKEKSNTNELISIRGTGIVNSYDSRCD